MPDGIECIHCGKDLSPDGTQPCPYCGKTGRKFNVSVSDRVSAMDGIGVGLRYGETGRFATHSYPSTPTDITLIEGHVVDFIDGKRAQFETYVEALVDDFSSIATGEGTFYRGVSAYIRDKVSGNTIGPSPAPNEGRYNVSGEKSIYLIDNLSFLSAEINADEMLVQPTRARTPRKSCIRFPYEDVKSTIHPPGFNTR